MTRATLGGEPRQRPRIHITGASGSGVSTLGAVLARRLDCDQLDTDAFYWLPTDPPYSQARQVAERLALITASFDAAAEGWSCSAARSTALGDPLIPHFERVVFLSRPEPCRLARLADQERERGRRGDRRGRHLAYVHHLDFSVATPPATTRAVSPAR